MNYSFKTTLWILSLCCISPLAYAGLVAPAPDASGADNSTAATAAPAARSAQAIEADLKEASMALQKSMPPTKDLLIADARAKAAPAAVPALWKMIGLLDELAVALPQSQTQLADSKYRFLILASVMGDAKADAALARDATSKDPAASLQAKAGQVLSEWIRFNTDASAQNKLLDQAEKLVKEHPDASVPAALLINMSQMGAASDALKERAEKIVTTESTSPVAKQVQQQAEAAAKLAALENKPLIIQGKTLDGSVFSSASYKGKVILVDFWASWCVPCKAELPRVKELYKQYHDKGFEIVGVSCDRQVDDLKSYLSANPDMPWMQLFEPGTTWHPLATQLGINSIPTMFLIDRNGICRTVKARENMEKLLPELLAETPSDKADAK